jgi:hypothetical protein
VVVLGAHPARASALRLSVASPARSRLALVVKDMNAFLSLFGGGYSVEVEVVEICGGRQSM